MNGWMKNIILFYHDFPQFSYHQNYGFMAKHILLSERVSWKLTTKEFLS